VLRVLRHPHIVSYLGISLIEETFYIMMEYMDGSLVDLFREKQDELNELDLIRM